MVKYNNGNKYTDNDELIVSPVQAAGSVVDGADVNAGSTTDAANTTGTTGTMSGKLRGIVTILASVANIVSGWFNVNLATAIDEDIDSITAYVKGFTKVKVSVDGVISGTPCVIAGYYVASSTGASISLFDNATTNTGDTIIATAKAVTTNDLVTLQSPVVFDNGCYLDFTAGSGVVYVFVRKLTAQ